MALDPKSFADWEIALDAEKRMPDIYEIGRRLGLEDKELLPYGHSMGKIDADAVLRRLGSKSDGKYVDVTAITPTPLGEGKSTTTIGLVQGLGKRGKKAVAAIRQPSGGPTMGTKGSAAGGGLSQCIPLTQYSLGFTGDINAVTNAHNLAMVALSARMQHERNYDDETLLRLSGQPRLNIDPTRVQMGWVIDFCCQSLRHIITGMGGRSDGYMMQSRFDISVSSEVMAILAVARDLADLRERMGRIVVAYSRDGAPVTTADLRVDGAMTAWMVEALKPNLIQTLEHTGALVHGGPFANIAHGCNSIRATKAALKMADYVITEAGFGADLGAEKFFDIKCRIGGLKPDAAVLVATVRALKYNGGVAKADLGKENMEALQKGISNLEKHMENLQKYGVPVVVTLNSFLTDTEEEISFIREFCEKRGCEFALSQVWEKGGEGGIALAQKVLETLENKESHFHVLYEDSLSLKDKIETVAKEIYGASGVSYSPAAEKQMKQLENLGFGVLPVCMAKTQYSLSDDPELLGRPRGFTMNVREMYVSAGAGFVVVLTGAVMTMPGLPKEPAALRIDVNRDGVITGLF